MAEETIVSEGGEHVGDVDYSTTNGTGTDAGSDSKEAEPSDIVPPIPAAEPKPPAEILPPPTETKLPTTHKPLPPPPVPPQPHSPRSMDVNSNLIDNKPPAHNNLKQSTEMAGSTPKLDRKGSVACIDPATGTPDDKKKVTYSLFFCIFVCLKVSLLTRTYEDQMELVDMGKQNIEGERARECKREVQQREGEDPSREEQHTNTRQARSTLHE
jgi:hypothetical protein